MKEALEYYYNLPDRFQSKSRPIVVVITTIVAIGFWSLNFPVMATITVAGGLAYGVATYTGLDKKWLAKSIKSCDSTGEVKFDKTLGKGHSVYAANMKKLSSKAS